jgi:transcriptional regulator GlxA family with amidase domain
LSTVEERHLGAILGTVNIGVALFEGVEELDWAGPWEVLATWSRFWAADAVDVFTVADRDTAIDCAKGARVLPDRTWSTVEKLDVLVYPGGQGTRAQLEPGDPLHERLTSLAASGTLMTSVCTGSLVYAAAGLLHGKPATTHWESLDDLASLDATIDVRYGERFVDAGQVITSAGVSAGIDMALYLVARLHSSERAAQIQHVIDYQPQPPATEQ